MTINADTGVETVSMIMILTGVLAAADPQQRGRLGHGAGRRQDVPQDVPEEQELPQEEDQGIAIVTSNLGVLHRYCIIAVSTILHHSHPYFIYDWVVA